MKAKSFVFFENYSELISLIRDEHLRIQVLEAVIGYGLHGRDPTFDDESGACTECFTVIKQKLDKANAKRRKYSEAAVARQQRKSINTINTINESTANNYNFGLDKSALRAQRNIRAIMSAPAKGGNYKK